MPSTSTPSAHSTNSLSYSARLASAAYEQARDLARRKRLDHKGFNEFPDKQSVVSAPTTPAGFAAFLKGDRKAAEALIKVANSKKTKFKAQ